MIIKTFDADNVGILKHQLLLSIFKIFTISYLEDTNYKTAFYTKLHLFTRIISLL